MTGWPLPNSGRVGQPEVIGQFQFPADGFYQLGVGGARGSGQIGVSVYWLDPADMEGGGVFTSMDQELRGRMTHPASYHTFRLPVQRGQRFDLSAVALTPDLDLQFELYGPDGAMLAARDDNVGKDPYLWNFMPSQTGTYTLVVSNFDEHVGDYKVVISPSTGGGEAVVGSRTTLQLEGTPRRSTWLTLQGRALDAIAVEARPADSGVDPQITVYDAYGNRLVTVNQDGPDQPETLTLLQFPRDGQYQLEFETLGASGSIQYLIQTTSSYDLDQGGTIVPGSKGGRAGEVAGPGTVLTFQFDGQIGELIGIDAHATSSTGLDLGFDLYTPDGYLLVTRDDSVGKNPAIDRLELPQTGRYALTIWNYADTTGTFGVFVNLPQAAQTAPQPTPTAAP